MVNSRRTAAPSTEPDELAANPPGVISDSTQTSRGESSRSATRPVAKPTNMNRIAALEERIEQLEAELALQQREKELKQLIRENGGGPRNPPETQVMNEQEPVTAVTGTEDNNCSSNNTPPSHR
ncbi:hypothetical protein H9Q69_012551 [Fusarium xylarioides]|nr:hypothetical protein H9Q69_012551 [Fusarium xylarioides]